MLRGKVFGVPNPPATIKVALTAATAAEAEKSPGKMVVGVIEEKETEKRGRKDGRENGQKGRGRTGHFQEAREQC